MNWGQACSALKKSWLAYKLAGRNGGYRADIGWRIQKIQRSMGIQVTQFEDVPYDGEELSE
jgi:hypothetical protein